MEAKAKFITKKKIMLAVLIVLVAGFIISLRPLSFKDSFDYITISLLRPFDVERPDDWGWEQFPFSREDAEFERLEEIMQSYTYHRSVTSYFRRGLTSRWVSYRFIVSLRNGDESQHIDLQTFSSFIRVNGTVHRMGYWGTARVHSFLDEIIDVIFE